MSDIKKSVIAAGWVVAAAGAVVLGSGLRDQADLSSPSHGVKIENLVASRDNFDGTRGQSEIPAGDFFYELTEKLKEEYVEPIGNEQKLATGAVRGMIGYLGDPKSTFMDKDEFRAYMNARQGKYEGIGADLEVLVPASDSAVNRSLLQPTPSEEGPDPRSETLAAPGKGQAPSFPRLTVTGVVPGGPADKAGVKLGDKVYSVDDRWVINGDLAIRFYKAKHDFDNKKITLSDLNVVRNEVREKYDRMLLPLRAKDRLFLGKAGAVKVVWERGGQQITTTLQRAPSTRPGITVAQDTIRLPFVTGAAEQLGKAIQGKPAVTIDLRNNSLGDFGVMFKCLAAVAPSGNYGYETTDRPGKPTAITVAKGNPNPPKLTLLTDRSTRGAAEIFALALNSKGLAKLSGSEMGGTRELYEIVELPDGSGYTLVTSRYRPELALKTARVAQNGTALNRSAKLGGAK